MCAGSLAGWVVSYSSFDSKATQACTQKHNVTKDKYSRRQETALATDLKSQVHAAPPKSRSIQVSSSATCALVSASIGSKSRHLRRARGRARALFDGGHRVLVVPGHCAAADGQPLGPCRLPRPAQDHLLSSMCMRKCKPVAHGRHAHGKRAVYMRSA